MRIFNRTGRIFFYFLPSHPHTYGSNALFIGVSSVRASVRASFLPSHPLTRSIPAGKPCLSEIYVTFCAYCFNPLRTGNNIWLNYSDFILSFI